MTLSADDKQRLRVLSSLSKPHREIALPLLLREVQLWVPSGRSSHVSSHSGLLNVLLNQKSQDHIEKITLCLHDGRRRERDIPPLDIDTLCHVVVQQTKLQRFEFGFIRAVLEFLLTLIQDVKYFLNVLEAAPRCSILPGADLTQSPSAGLFPAFPMSWSDASSARALS
jgi:hypothetical protein